MQQFLYLVQGIVTFMLMDLKIKQLIQVCVSLVDSAEVSVKNTSFLGWLLKL